MGQGANGGAGRNPDAIDDDGPRLGQPARTATVPAHLERGSRRDTMLLIATIRRADGTETPLRVRNLSASGLMGEMQVPLAEGAEIKVALRNIGDVRARVVWMEGLRVGLEFLTALDPQQVRQRRPTASIPEIGLIRPARDQRSARPALKRG